MNFRMMKYIISQILRIEAILMSSALLVSIIYKEQRAGYSFLVTALVLGVIGMLLTIKKPDNKVIYPKEGLIVVSISWIVMAICGAFPFYLSGSIPSFIDCIFETISGFTTTGASILTDVETLPKGMLYWRSFTHWIGGMGVLVLVLSLIRNSTGHNLHLLRAEVPGPSVEKLVPKLRRTATILYGIYVLITLIEIVILLILGMPLFDSIVNAFATAGTGGFAIKNASIGFYSPALQWVIGIFMLIFGINFNIFYLLMVRNIKAIINNEEFKVYLSIALLAILIITWNINPIYRAWDVSLRNATFQVASVMSTTGFATTDFSKWPELSRVLLVLLMFIGASAGSTAGGLKVARIVIVFKTIKREMIKMIHPNAYCVIKQDGRVLDEKVVNGTAVYLMIYLFIMLMSVVLISLDGFDSETTFTSVVACFNNIGPGLGLVGPTGNYSSFSDLSKIVLSIDMLMGRLEIFPLVILVTPTAWKNV